MKFSVVVPAFNEEGNLEELCRQVEKNLIKAEITHFEILFVNDGSSDGTMAEIKRLAKNDDHIKYVSFSRNFGHQSALRAGLDQSDGDAVISMDADLQHPPELLPEMIQKWRAGNDIVYTLRKDTKETSLVKRLFSSMFYKISNVMMGIELEAGAADFRLLDRRVVAIVNAIPERRLFLRAFIKWAGFRQTSIEYVPAARHSGQSKYSPIKLMRLALDGITQFSIRPLRLITLLGLVTIMISVIYGGYVAWVHFTTHQTVPGWASLMIVVIILFGVQFIVLGTMGEYMGRTFLLAKNWPDYIVDETNCEPNAKAK
jgi:glycosyltransferase involved in cell wall biosynthesis